MIRSDLRTGSRSGSRPNRARAFVALAVVAGLVAVLVASGGAASGEPGDGFTKAAPGRELQFPRDHFPHQDFGIEWWYFTGHLRASAGDGVERTYGYQFTFFRVGLSPRPATGTSRFASNALIMGHAAITDIANDRHVFRDVVWRAAPITGGFADGGDAVDSIDSPGSTETQTANDDSRTIATCPAPNGGGADWTLAWNAKISGFDFAAHDDRSGGIGFELSTRVDPRDARATPVLHGDRGCSRKDATGDSASHYYSFTRLATTGTLTLDGETRAVDGVSWMDHEFSSNSLSRGQVGWDWFSLQLDDGRDLMLYRLRGRDRADDYASGTLVASTGEVRALEASEFRLEAGRTWKSEATGAEYPVVWTVEVPGESLTLRVRPLVDAAENVSRLVKRLHYWEGPVVIEDAEGRTLGRGYLEMTGYGKDARLPL